MKIITTFLLMLITQVFLLVFGALAFVLNVFRKFWRKESLLEYFLSIIVSSDQYGGAILFATEDFTISSTLYKLSENNKVAKYAMVVVDALAKRTANGLHRVGFINEAEWKRQQTHCKSAYVRELEEFALKTSSAVAMLEFDELVEFFLDDSYEKFMKKNDDGSLSLYGWCCDFSIVKDGNVIESGKRGDGIVYLPKSNKFEIERF